MADATNSLSLIEIDKTKNTTTKYAINEMVLAILLQWIPVNFGSIAQAQNALTLLTDRIILAFYKARSDAVFNGIDDKITIWLQNFQGNNVGDQYNFNVATYSVAHTLVDRAGEISIELSNEEWQKIIDVIPKTTGATQQKLFADQIRLVSTAVLACYTKLDAGQQGIVNTKNKEIILNKVDNVEAIAAVAAVVVANGVVFPGPDNIKQDFIFQGIAYAAPAIAAAGADDAAAATDTDTALATELGVTPFAGNKPPNWNFKMWCSLLVKIAIDGAEVPASASASASNLVEEVIDITYMPGIPNETKSLLFDKFNQDNNGAKIKKFWTEYLLSTGESKLAGGNGTRRRNRNSSKRRSQKKSRKLRKSRRKKSRKSRKRMRKSYKK